MKRSFTSGWLAGLVFCLWAGCLSAQGAAFRSGEARRLPHQVTVSPLAPNLWLHRSVADIGGFQDVASNGLILLGRSTALLIDTPATVPQTESLLAWAKEEMQRPITRFIATHEANASDDYKQMIVSSKAADIVYTPVFTGVHGSYLKGSIENAGLDPDHLPDVDRSAMDFGSSAKSDAKAWRDIWGAGQGVGSIDDILPTRDLVLRIEAEYDEARARLAGNGRDGS